jgi:hypothetical protein
MRTGNIADTLDGDDVLAVDAGQRCQARVDAGVVETACGRVVLRDYDRAGAAAAFATSSGCYDVSMYDEQ